MRGVRRFPPGHSLKRRGLVVWPWGEAACVQEVVERLGERWPQAEREAAIWKRCAESAARGHLLVDLSSVSLTRLTPLICLPSDAALILPDPLPSELSESRASFPEEEKDESDQRENPLTTFDDSTLEGPVRERFLRNVRAVEQVLTGSSVVEVAQETQIARSTLSRLVQRARALGVRACVPYATYSREREMHPAFQAVIRRLYQLPTKLSLTAIAEHADLVRAAKRVQEDTGSAPALPSYKQVRSFVRVLKLVNDLKVRRNQPQ
jgi:transposase